MSKVIYCHGINGMGTSRNAQAAMLLRSIHELVRQDAKKIVYVYASASKTIQRPNCASYLKWIVDEGYGTIRSLPVSRNPNTSNYLYPFLFTPSKKAIKLITDTVNNARSFFWTGNMNPSYINEPYGLFKYVYRYVDGKITCEKRRNGDYTIPDNSSQIFAVIVMQSTSHERPTAIEAERPYSTSCCGLNLYHTTNRLPVSFGSYNYAAMFMMDYEDTGLYNHKVKQARKTNRLNYSITLMKGVSLWYVEPNKMDWYNASRFKSYFAPNPLVFIKAPKIKYNDKEKN